MSPPPRTSRISRLPRQSIRNLFPMSDWTGPRHGNPTLTEGSGDGAVQGGPVRLDGHRVEQADELLLLEPEVGHHDRLDAVEMPEQLSGVGTAGQRPFEVPDQVGEHVVVLDQGRYRRRQVRSLQQ